MIAGEQVITIHRDDPAKWIQLRREHRIHFCCIEACFSKCLVKVGTAFFGFYDEQRKICLHDEIVGKVTFLLCALVDHEFTDVALGYYALARDAQSVRLFGEKKRQNKLLLDITFIEKFR
ncbi:hypothetical protein J6497_36875 [Bradyrhizobium sp. CNPSo 4026]|nr:hypothetical protein [Bradyrhizobium cenepequi]